MPFGFFGVDVAFYHHFVAIRSPLILPPYRSASGIVYTRKNYLKWQAIQLVIHSIVDE